MAAGGGWSYHLVHIHQKKETTKLIFRQIYWARYIDWAITTPLLLIELTVLAGLPGIEILLLIFADIAMILFVYPLIAKFNVRDYLLHLRIGSFNVDIIQFLPYFIYTLFSPFFVPVVAKLSRETQELGSCSPQSVFTQLLFGPYIQLYGPSETECKEFLSTQKSFFTLWYVAFNEYRLNAA